MKSRVLVGVALLVAVLVPVLVNMGGSASAQSRMASATAAADAQPDTRSPASPNLSTDGKPAVTAMPSDPGNVVLSDPGTRQRYLDAMQRYYEYRANGYAYRSRVFEWQLLSSRVIFMVVLVLVGAGIYFAAVQFRGAMHAAARPAAEASPPAPGVGLATQLEVSAKGIVVNSSVMGVIILTLSLAFFYLYLVYVYPITDAL
jgi:hypothetical protein